MSSRTQIANKALRRLGSDEIADIDDTDSESARSIKSVFDTCVDEVLASHPWNCALERASLAADATAPSFGFAHAYTLPADPWCLRVLALESDDIRFKVEGRKILTDEGAPLKIQFIKRVTDPEQLAPWVTDAVAAKIAWDVAYRLTQSASREAAMEKRYDTTLARSRSTDAAEGTPDPVVADELLNARL